TSLAPPTATSSRPAEPGERNSGGAGRSPSPPPQRRRATPSASSLAQAVEVPHRPDEQLPIHHRRRGCGRHTLRACSHAPARLARCLAGAGPFRAAAILAPHKIMYSSKHQTDNPAEILCMGPLRKERTRELSPDWPIAACSSRLYRGERAIRPPTRIL